jgi:phage baseplate assembly protein W
MSRYTGLFRLYPIHGQSEDGFVEHDKVLVQKSIMNLINTHKGSRIYDPDYGTNLYRLVHEFNIQRTRNIARTEIEQAINKYEPRAKVLNVGAYAGEGDKAHEVVIIVSILYVEFNETDDLELRLATDRQWIDKEGKPVDPAADWFKKGMK